MYKVKIIRNESDQDYGRQFVFPAGTDVNDAIEELYLDGIDAYRSRDVWDQIFVVIEGKS